MVRLRLFVIAGIVIVGIVAALLVTVHLGPVRTSLAAWAAGRLREAGIEARFRAVSYNLFALNFTVRDVVLAARGSEATPFLRADELSVTLPWSVTSGRMAARAIRAINLRLDFLRRADGSWNLPTSADSQASSLERFVFDALLIRNARVQYRDETADVDVVAEAITIDLQPRSPGVSAGSLTIGEGPRVRVGDRQSVATHAAGRLAFDGAGVSIETLGLDAPEGQLTARGRLDSVFSRPRSSVELTGNVSLARLSPWLGLEPNADGTITVATSITGALGEPEARIDLSSKSASWRHFKNVSVRGGAHVDTSGVTVHEVVIDLGSGTLSSHGRVALDGSTGTVHVDWWALSAADLFAPDLAVPLGAALQGTMDVKWTAPGVEALDVIAENHSTPTERGPTALPIEGQSLLRIENGEWRLVHGHQIARAVGLEGVLRGRLSPETFGRSTITGTAAIVIQDAQPLVASFRGAGIALPAWLDQLNARVDANLEVNGLLESPRASGTGRVQEFEWMDIGPGEATFRLAADSRGLNVDALEAVLAGNRASGFASLQVESGTLAGTARFDLRELAALLPAARDPWQPSGALTADVQIGGALSSPSAMGTFQGHSMTVASQQVSAMSGRFDFADGQLSVTEVELQQPTGGRLSVGGTFVPSTRAYSVTVRGSDFTVTPVGESGSILPVDTAMALEFSGQGTLDHPRGNGRLTFSRLSWRELHLGPGDVSVELSDAGVHLDSRLPELNTRIGGTVQIASPWLFDLAADIVDADLSALAGRGLIAPSPFLAELDGRASLTATGTGNFERIGDSRIDIAVRALEIKKEMLALQLVRPATLQFERTRITADGFELRTGETVISAAGGLGPSLPGLQIQLSGDLRDVASWLATFRPDDRLSMQGRMDGVIRASGSVDRTELTGQLTVAGATAQVGDLPPLDAVTLSAELSEGILAAPQIGARWQGAALSGRASVPLPLLDRWLPTSLTELPAARGEVAQITLRVDNLTPAVLGAFLATVPERLEGTAAAVLDLQANALELDRLTGSLTVERLDGNVSGVALTQTVPTRLEVANGRVRVDDWVWDASGNRLAVTGEASLLTRDLDVALIGRVDMRMIGGFVPGTTTGGATEIGLRFTGPVAAPAIDGTLLVQDGELQSIDPQVVLDAVSGRILLEGGRLQVVDMAGSVNGGPFTLAGELRHEGFMITAGQLDFSGGQIALNVPQGFRTEVDAELVLLFEAGNPRLTGRATIQRGAYREPLSLAAGLLGAARRRRVAAGRPEATWLDQLSLNVAISSVEDLIVDNNYGRLDLALVVRLVGSAGRPAIVGRAEVREGGVLYLGGRAYQVESGVIDFVDQNEIRPDLNIVARTRVSDVDITLTITGAPDTLQGELSSSDTRWSQSDLVSLLLTGRLSSDIGGAETTIAREQLLALLSGEVLGFAAQAVGLDTIRLERGAGVEELRFDPSLIAGEADPSSRLTLSKNFSRYAEVVLSQDLQESGDLTWIFGVTPTRGLEIRTVSRDDQSRSYEIRHDVSFGQPAGSPSSTRPTRTEDGEERIAEVRFGGAPRVPVRELDTVLKLRAGDRFDFYQWQSDRERLRRVYLDRSHFEARVTARRYKVDEATQTILEYVIRPGPRTTLKTTGVPIPDRVRRDLETLWSNAVFEEVLFTDMERRVRSFLIEEGYVGAAVEVSRSRASTEDEKSIEVAIGEGVRSRSREIAFTGNEIVPTRRLEALVRERELEISSWVDPTLLEGGIRDLYEELGLLNVSVAVGEPEITADRGVLPVRISEGLQFNIVDILITGVARLPEIEVREAFGLQSGEPYGWPAVETGRRAVEAAYRRQGFNAVRTEVREEVDGARAEVRLTLNVDEGAQQVLQTVELEGAEGLRPNSLSRALALETGAPADLSSWQQARRRLLETGLFRSVDIEAVPIETARPADQGTQPVAAHFRLHRWPFWRLRYGFEIADELAPLGDSRVFGPGFTADLQRRTVWGLPVNVGTSFRMTPDDRIGRVFLSAPNFFTLPLSTTLFVSRSREDINEGGFLAFITDKTTVTAEQRFRRGRAVQFSYGYQYDRDHTFDPNPNPNDPLPLDLTVSQARLTSTGLLDRRDDPFDATAGLMHSSTFEYGPEALGSDLRFIKYFGQQLYFRPIGAGIVSASAVRFGVGRGFGGQELIFSERFFAGGASTVRGYREDSLGGIDFFGLPVGGQGVLIFNQEARFPIYRWLRGVGFVDAGNVFRRASDLSFDLKTSVGLGLRLATPVGMFRVDFGVPLSNDNNRQRPRWHFSLGQMF